MTRGRKPTLSFGSSFQLTFEAPPLLELPEINRLPDPLRARPSVAPELHSAHADSRSCINMWRQSRRTTRHPRQTSARRFSIYRRTDTPLQTSETGYMSRKHILPNYGELAEPPKFQNPKFQSSNLRRETSQGTEADASTRFAAPADARGPTVAGAAGNQPPARASFLP